MIISQYSSENLSELTYLMNQWSDEVQYEESQLARHIEVLTQKSDNRIFVAKDDNGEVIGDIFTGICYYLGFDPFVEIIQLLVDKDSRSQGVGAKLIEFVSEYYKKQGIGEIKLHSRSDRERAHEFYKKLGFKEFKESKFFRKHL